MDTLLSVAGSLGAYDDEKTIYAVPPWTPSSVAVVAFEPPGGGLPKEAVEIGATYFIEIFIAQEFLAGWRQLEGRMATEEEACERLILYAVNDA